MDWPGIGDSLSSSVCLSVCFSIYLFIYQLLIYPCVIYVDTILKGKSADKHTFLAQNLRNKRIGSMCKADTDGSAFASLSVLSVCVST